MPEGSESESEPRQRAERVAKKAEQPSNPEELTSEVESEGDQSGNIEEEQSNPETLTALEEERLLTLQQTLEGLGAACARLSLKFEMMDTGPGREMMVRRRAKLMDHIAGLRVPLLELPQRLQEIISQPQYKAEILGSVTQTLGMLSAEIEMEVNGYMQWYEKVQEFSGAEDSELEELGVDFRRLRDDVEDARTAVRRALDTSFKE
jgi:hypothetical protein